MAELPNESAELIKKLSDWELELQVELKDKIKTKRSEIVEILEKHLDSTTRAGDLEGAISLKKEIERLQATLQSAGEDHSDPLKELSADEVKGLLTEKRIRIVLDPTASKENDGELHFLEFDFEAMQGLWDRGKHHVVYRRPIEITTQGAVKFYPDFKEERGKYWEIRPDRGGAAGEVKCKPRGDGKFTFERGTR